MGWNRARATLSCNGRTWGQVCTSTLELPYRHEPRPPGGVGLIGPEPQLAWWYAGDGELTRTGWGTAFCPRHRPILGEGHPLADVLALAQQAAFDELARAVYAAHRRLGLRRPRVGQC